MLITNDFQRFALDTDTFAILDNRQGGKVYHDYSNDYYAKNYIRWCVENCPERLQEWCDKGYIYGHIMDKVDECIAEQNKIWKHMIETDKEYLQAVENANTTKVWQFENLFEMEAKQVVLDTVAYR